MSKASALLSNFFQWLDRHRSTLWRYAYIVSITFAIAKSATLIIAYKYFPIEVPRPRRMDYSAGTSSAPKDTNTQAIISRNLFDSEAQNRIRSAMSGHFGNQIVPSTLPLELVGTMVFKSARFSVALIRDRSSKTAQYYAVGESISSARIHKIERFRVIVENGGRLESLELKAGESKLMTQLKAETEARNAAGGDAEVFEEAGPNHFVIPQSVIDDVLSNFSVVLTQARMVPNLTPDNKTDGFKVFQIRGGSIYERLKMKDNDIIKRVNGMDLDSFEKATGLFTALRSEKSISIDLVRNGQRISYTYEIR